MAGDSKSQLALLAARVYFRADNNRIPVPAGWDELTWTGDAPLSGFSAGVYRNRTDPKQIVIAFTGTNDRKIADLVNANMPAVIGAPSPQVFAAIDLVRQTMKDHPMAEITFTGHSLGGGLASLMAAYFDRPATVFAPAPFERSATTALTVFAYYAAYVAGTAVSGGAVSPAFSAFATAPSALLSSREAAVSEVLLQGEFISTWPGLAQLPKISGDLQVIDPGLTAASAIDLHSMSLHAAMLLSDDFSHGVSSTPSLLTALFDERLYYRDPQFDSRRNLLDHLLRHELGVPGSFLPTAMLARFGQELSKLGEPQGDGPAKIDGLLAALMQHYYSMTDGFTQEFFALIPGGLRFDLPDGDGVGLGRFADAVQLASEAGDRVSVAGLMQASQRFYVQSGMNALTVTGDDTNDTIVGGVDADSLSGAGGADLLVGGAGGDELTGGPGSDHLLGGAGNDIYRFGAGGGDDVIVDADGIGLLMVGDGAAVQLHGGNRAGDNYWLSDTVDGARYGFTRVQLRDESGAVIRTDLIITKGSSLDRISIRDWQQGRLGITLSDTPAQFAAADERATAPQGTVGYELTGDTGGEATRDELVGSGGVDLLHGLLGDDRLDGGDDGDILVGGLGADRIVGGAGNDVVHGGGHLPGVVRGTAEPPTDEIFVWLNDGPGWYAGLTTDGTLSVGGALFGYTAETGGPNDADAGDLIDSGDGHDWVYGDAGADVIDLGAGDDIANGGQGADIIFGGDGADHMLGDYSNTDAYVFLASEHGADVLIGDDGDDVIEGAGGDDRIYGGADDDVLWGDDTGGLPASYHGHDLLDGGGGNDQLSGQGGNDTLYGGSEDDLLVGDDTAMRLAGEHHGADHLDGEEGNDQLQGQGGADALFGGAGNDALFGDDGTAVLAGQFHGADHLDGEDGDDYLEGQGGADELFGGDGADTLFGDSTAHGVDPAFHGDDLLDGEGGDDWLIGGGGRDTLFGGAGSDQLQGDDVDSNLPAAAHDDDYLDGEEGDDVLAGQGGADTLYGGDGNDTLMGDAVASQLAASANGNDFLDGGAGVDTLIGGGGDDVLSGGDGNDVLDGDDSIDNLEPAAHGSDTLYGDAGDDSLTGAGGDDRLHGGSGSDTLRGDAADIPESAHGADVLDGGEGNDGLVGGGNADTLSGGDGDDILVGDDAQAGLGDSAQGDDFLDGGSGVDVLIGTGGADTLVGGTDDDTLWGDASPLNAVADSAHGDDLLEGGDGNDGLIGGGGADTLRGGAGNDLLWGDGYSGQAGTLTVAAVFRGADVLEGGAGDDYLSGGDGDDLYVFASGDGNDRISDGGGGPAANRIRLLSANPGEARLARAGGDLIVAFGSGFDSITVEGHFASPNQQISSIEFADGTIWNGERILDEVYRATAISGGPGSETIDGTAGDDLIRAAGGDDTISGWSGADRLHGEDGNDVLYGGDGDDFLDGGAGGNRLYGGANADTYWVEATASNEIEARNWMGQVDGVAEDILVFGPGVGPQNLSFKHEPDERYVPSSGTFETIDGSLFMRITDRRSDLFKGSVRIESFFAATPAYNGGIKEVRFADLPGLSWTGEQLRALALTGGERSDTISGTRRDDVLAGGGGDDSLYGDKGNDRLDGGGGDDLLFGGAGDDVFVYARGDGSDEIDDESGTDALEFGPGIDPAEFVLTRISQHHGAEPADTLVVQFGDSNTQIWIPGYFLADGSGRIEQFRFAGGATWNHADVLARVVDRRGAADDKIATAGDDLYEVDHAGDRIVEQAGGGYDRIVSSVSYTLPAEVEELSLTGTLNLNATGNEGHNVIRGNDGANALAGAGGRDTLLGGLGDDRYSLTGKDSGDVEDTVIEAENEGDDSVVVDNWTYTLPAHVENLKASGLGYYFNRVNDPLDPVFGWLGEPRAFSVQAFFGGNGSANRIDANVVPLYRLGDANQRGNILIDGGAGADTLVGSLANDTYVIDDAGDRIIEPGAREDGTQISTGDGIVTPFAISLVTEQPDIERVELVGAQPAAAEGNSADNVLIASGNPAVNILSGGAGNDVYVVDENDVVVEPAAGGTDTVFIDADQAARTRTTYELAQYAHVENIAVTGRSGGAVLLGDDGENELTGSGGSEAAGVRDDRLEGGAGNDILRESWFGDAGRWGYDADELIGGDGDDRLESEWGLDILDGGAGDDVFKLGVDSEASVVFGTGHGVDTVERAAGSQKHVRWTVATDLTQVRVSRAGLDVVIGLQGQGDTLTLREFFDAGGAIASAIDRWQLADGTVLTRDAIAAAIGAADRTTATDGADLLIAAAAGGAVDGGLGDDWLIGQGGDDHLIGQAGNDNLLGGDGDDTLDGGAGDDFLHGGRGADVYRFGVGSGIDSIEDDRVAAAPDASLDAIVFDASVTPDMVTIELSGSGIFVSWGDGSAVDVRGFSSTAGDGTGTLEEVRFADGAVWDHAELVRRAHSIYGTAGDDVLEVPVDSGLQVYGLAGNDRLTGGSGNDLLDGGPGSDQMSGGAGDDLYVVDGAADVVTEYAGEGTDTVMSSASRSLGSNQENLTLTGNAPVNGTGNSLANVLAGNGASNTLNGGSGADSMVGGGGNDTFVVDNAGDVVTENAGEGIDLVRSSVSYTLGAHVENLTLTGTSAISGTGNAQDNLLTGNGASNTLTGGAGNDWLDGAAGSDTMRGGTGDDTYVVNVSTDAVTENANEGADTILSSVTLTLASNIEHLTLTGTGAISGTGNALANHLRGNGAGNVLNGAGGNDVLQGAAGNDTLTDTSGNNVLDGGVGADALSGGTGREFVAGGAGNDTLKLGGGADIVAFNRGHGADSVSAPTSGAGLGESNDTISLGGVRYADLRLARSGSDLLVKVAGTTDSIKLTGWYSASGNRTVTTLQLVVDSTVDYAPSSSDPLVNRRVVRLNFGTLVTAFNSAFAANSAVGDWAIPAATLSSAFVAGSDTQAIGGALAYHYARDGNLGALDFAAAGAVLGDAGFATSAQTFSAVAAAGGARLMSAGQAGTEGEVAVARIAAAPLAGGDGSTEGNDQDGDPVEGTMRSPRRIQALAEIWAGGRPERSDSDSGQYLAFDSWARAAEPEIGAAAIATWSGVAAAAFDAQTAGGMEATRADVAELALAATVARRWIAADEALVRLDAGGRAWLGGEAVDSVLPLDDALLSHLLAMANSAQARQPRSFVVVD